MIKFTVFALLFALSAVTSVAQTRRPMAPADVLRVVSVSDAQISPNGQWIVYTVSSVDEDKNFTTLWIAR